MSAFLSSKSIPGTVLINVLHISILLFYTHGTKFIRQKGHSMKMILSTAPSPDPTASFLGDVSCGGLMFKDSTSAKVRSTWTGTSGKPLAVAFL